MASINVTKFGQAIKLLPIAAPASPENGMIYYDVSANVIKFYQNGGWISAGDASSILASSISDGDITHAPDGNSVFDALAGKLATGGTAADSSKLNGQEASYYAVASALANYLALAGGTMSGALTLSGAPSSANHAATKEYVDQLVITGAKVKEALLITEQMSNSQGILAAEVAYFTAVPTADQTFVIKNASTTETYTFKAARGSAFEVTIGGSEDVTEANLAAAINLDSAVWSAKLAASGLDVIEDDVVVVYEKATASGASTSRLYGSASNAYVVAYNSDIEYSTKAGAAMPSSDPAAGRFGFRHQIAALEDGEIHVVLETNEVKSWNSSLTSWVTLSGSGSLPDATAASGGGTKGKVSFDSDFGLAVNSGVAKIAITASAGLKFNSSTKALEADVGTGSTQVSAGNHNHSGVYDPAGTAAGIIASSISDGDTTHCPDGNSVFDALAGKLSTSGTAADSSKLNGQSASYYALASDLSAKLSAVVDDSTPELGGALDASTNAIYSSTGLKLGDTSTQFQLNKYVHTQTLTASQTNAVASNLTFAFATYSSCIVEYQIKEATTGRVRSGQLFVSTDGTDVAISDSHTETADCGVTWNGVISGSDVNIRYTTTANNKTMRAMQKLFLV